MKYAYFLATLRLEQFLALGNEFVSACWKFGVRYPVRRGFKPCEPLTKVNTLQR